MKFKVNLSYLVLPLLFGLSAYITGLILVKFYYFVARLGWYGYLDWLDNWQGVEIISMVACVVGAVCWVFSMVMAKKRKKKHIDIEIETDPEKLKEKSKNTTLKDVKFFKLIERMKEALPKAWTKGYGFAAIQIGYPLNFAWYTLLDKEYTLLNPHIVKYSCGVIIAEEGCLSIPDKWFRTYRYSNIVYTSEHTGIQQTYEAKGIQSIIIQHVTDLMCGIFPDQRSTPLEPKTGRNAPCPCGSGKKYKKCCMEKEG